MWKNNIYANTWTLKLIDDLPGKNRDYLKRLIEKLRKKFPDALVEFCYAYPNIVGAVGCVEINMVFKNEADEAFFKLIFCEFIS